MRNKIISGTTVGDYFRLVNGINQKVILFGYTKQFAVKCQKMINKITQTIATENHIASDKVEHMNRDIFLGEVSILHFIKLRKWLRTQGF